MDNLALSIQMSNVIVLAMVRAIKMNGVSCCVIANVERLSRSEMDGHGGTLRLRISGGLFLTPETEGLDSWTEPERVKVTCCPLNPCGALCGWS